MSGAIRESLRLSAKIPTCTPSIHRQRHERSAFVQVFQSDGLEQQTEKQHGNDGAARVRTKQPRHDKSGNSTVRSVRQANWLPTPDQSVGAVCHKFPHCHTPPSNQHDVLVSGQNAALFCMPAENKWSWKIATMMIVTRCVCLSHFHTHF